VFDHGSFCDASRLAKVSFVLALSRLSILLRQSQSLLYSLDRCSMLTRLRKSSSPPICRERRLTGRIADISARIGRTGAEKSAECRYGQICLKSARRVKKARRSNGLQAYTVGVSGSSRLSLPSSFVLLGPIATSSSPSPLKLLMVALEISSLSSVGVLR